MPQHPPIVSPWYLQYERYPNVARGANYVRPVFREHGRYGNFRARPIERIVPAFGTDDGPSITERIESAKTWHLAVGAFVVVGAIVLLTGGR